MISLQTSDIMKQSTRILTFDVVKFVAIFSVLWGHIIQYLHHGICYENAVYQIIYSYHMPLFMVVVGFFGATCMKKGFRKLMRKKVQQLILPGVTIAVIICLIMRYVKLGGVIDTLVFSLWFLKSAFLCFLFYSITFLVPCYRSWFIFVTLILSQVIFYSQFNLMYPCFLFGVLLKTFWEDVRNRALLFSIISGIVFFSMLIFWDASFWKIPSGGIYPVRNVSQLLSFSWQFYYRLLIGLSGAVFIITTTECLCQRYPKSKSIILMSHIGRNTLGIYLIQTVIIEVLLWRWFNFDSYNLQIFQMIVAPIFSTVVLALCLLSIRLIRKSRLTSLLFLGER